MPLRLIALALGAWLASQEAKAACVIHGARPTVPLPTMLSGQEFSFIASPDCETLHFTIRGTTLSKTPRSGEQVGPGPMTYKVNLTEREWDAVVAEIGPTLTWVVTGRTSAGVTTRMVTTNDLKREETIAIDLSTADAKLVGEGDDRAGNSVSGAGDVNSDGHDDLLIGANRNDEGGTWAGAAYLVLGPITGTLDLSDAHAKLVGEEPVDYAGDSVAGAGDVDGDGHDDVLVGAPNNDGGNAYLVSGPVTGTFELSLADAKLVSDGPGDIASTVSAAGDVDGDGHDDVLVGAYWNDEGGHQAGAAYLVLGPVTGTLDLSLADAKLVGEESDDEAGSHVSGAGDVDADGHPDLLVGAFESYEGLRNAGAAYLVLGPVSGTIDLSAADAKLVGERRDDHAGVVSGAGDVDGDGNDDVLVGAPYNDESALVNVDVGAAYLVLGPITGTLDLSYANAKLVGEEEEWSGYAGFSVSGAGDVDGDGHDDLLVGAPLAGSGAAYLVLGPVTGRFDLALADVKLVGEEENDWAGDSVSGAGDVDGDGRADLLVGAPRSPGFTDVGAAYLVYGGGL